MKLNKFRSLPISTVFEKESELTFKHKQQTKMSLVSIVSNFKQTNIRITSTPANIRTTSTATFTYCQVHIEGFNNNTDNIGALIQTHKFT